ncbi:MAG: hypothetical protein AAB857_03495 [Patescibacteria group bacterium]
MANPRNQNRPQGQPLAVREVRLDQVGRDGRTLKGRVAGKVARGDKPAEGVNLILLVGGVQTQNSPLQTDANGEASDDFAVPMEPEINRALIEARIEHGPSARRPVDITAASSGPKKKVVDKVAVDASGGEGDYIVSIMVSAQDRSAIEDIDVIILDDTEAFSYKTDSAGSTLHRISFEEKSRCITVQVPGVEPQKLRLLGPRPGSRHREARSRMPWYMNFLHGMRYSNDYRLKVLWSVTGLFLIAALTSFLLYFVLTEDKMYTPKKETAGYEVLKQRLVDNGLLEQSKINKSAETEDKFALGWTLLKVFVVLFWISVIYTPIAKREEMAYIASKAWDKASSWKDLPDIFTNETPGGENSGGTQRKEPKTQKILGWMNLLIFGREFLAAIFGDLVSGRKK